MRCPLCSGPPGPPFFELARVPVLCNQLEDSPQAAREVPRGALALAACRRCGHVFNARFESEKVVYGPGYDNDLHGSALFGSFAAELAADLVARHGLRGRRVLELGCGRGRFLELLLAAGAGSALGVDPSFRPRPLPDGLRILRALPEAEEPADFGLSRHVLEHLAAPATLLAQLHGRLRAGAGAYVEVPDFQTCLDRHLYWDVIYEHVSCFTPASLRRCCQAAGFTVEAVRPGFAGQFLGLELRRGAALAPAEAQGAPDVVAFAAGYRPAVERWSGFLQNHPRSVVWGAGSKGVMFRAAVSGGLPLVVDINPRKQGRFLPGSAARVIAPRELREHAVEQVLVMNPQYLQEIRASLAGLGVAAGVEVVTEGG